MVGNSVGPVCRRRGLLVLGRPSGSGGGMVALVADLITVNRAVAPADLVRHHDRPTVSGVGRARQFQDDGNLRKAQYPPLLGRGHTGPDLVVVPVRWLAESGEDLLRAGRTRRSQRAVPDQVVGVILIGQ